VHTSNHGLCVVENPKSKKKSASLPKRKKCKVMNLACRVTGNDLKPLGTDWRKPFLETAPSSSSFSDEYMNLALTAKKNNYYVQESVGIAAGFLLAAIHQVGLVSLTHT
jgi:hypothetical protein